MLFDNLLVHLSSHREILISPKGVTNELVFEHHVSVIPFTTNGSNPYGLVDITKAPRMSTILSVLDDFLRTLETHFQ